MCNKRTSFCLKVMVGAAYALACCACISVTAVNIGSKSSLERQLIGELEPLSEEETLAASVRAQAQVGTGSLDELQAAAVAARRRQLFNRDDIDEAKTQGCIGEGKDARLARRTCAPDADTEASARLATLIEQENADREAVVAWALATDPSLTTTDRPQVIQVYRRLLTENTRPGDWLETDDGTWVKR